MFGLGIRALRYPDGKVEFKVESANKGVPREIVIMQIKAFLKNLEDEYFDDFSKGTIKFKKDE